MFRPRIIPILLLKNLGLVKSVKFKNYNYIGDPINAVKLFNDLKADELVFLDINASKQNRLIPLEFVKNVGEEANMPFAVGGGIKSITDIVEIINAGAEKVILNSFAYNDKELISEASKEFGASTIAVSIDVKKQIFKSNRVFIYSGKKSTGLNPVEYAKIIENSGAGELIVNSIDRDGTMSGYDIDLIKDISQNVSIPVVALGGAGSLSDFRKVIFQGYASAVAAGSLFVYHGHRNAVLINYPSKEELINLFNENLL